MKIKATFIDEISHDIPHQNWGYSEWDKDFEYMKNAGIEMVVLIRSGYRRWQTFSSSVLKQEMNCFEPTVDLVEMFLKLSDKHGLKFYFGTYDSGKYWISGKYREEIDLNKRLIDEVWERYGKFSSFGGWYLSQECSRATAKIASLYSELGNYCKEVSGGLPVMISPYIDGKKNISQYISETVKDQSITVEQHEKEWDYLFSIIKDSVDIVAFQDGHVDYDELVDFLAANKRIADKYGLQCWTNTETFDRDMPIKFLPIKWDKLYLKMGLAQQVGIESAITFEFSHFMSPQSAYIQAKHLYNRYQEWLSTQQ